MNLDPEEIDVPAFRRQFSQLISHPEADIYNDRSLGALVAMRKDNVPTIAPVRIVRFARGQTESITQALQRTLLVRTHSGRSDHITSVFPETPNGVP